MGIKELVAIMGSLASAPSSPASGYRAWYRADQYAAGTWTDLSANGYNLSGGTAPTAVGSDSNFNSKPVVDFNGTTHNLVGTTMSNLISNSAFTIFGVFRAESFAASDSSAGAQRSIFCAYSGGNSVGYGVGLTKSEAWNYDGATDYTGPAISLNTVYGFNLRHDSGNLKNLVAGKSETSVASGNSSALTDTFRMGIGFVGTPYFDGQIAELIIYNTVLSAGDQTTTQDYLAARYGFTW